MEEHIIRMLKKGHANLWARTVMHKLIYYLLEQWFNSIWRYLTFTHILHSEKKVMQVEPLVAKE